MHSNKIRSKDTLISEYFLFIIALLSIIIMSFYIYIKKFIPIIPYVKDTLLISILPLLLLALIASSYRIKKFNFLDTIIFSLFIYLLFQFFRTGHVLSFAAAYSGFRLTFMYIILYFLFKSISSRRFLDIIDKTLFTILFIGLIITFMEGIFIKTGLVSVDILEKFMIVNRYPWQEYNRVYGITGSVHITGVYNFIFFAMLLFGLHLKRSGKKYNHFFLIEKIQSLRSKKLLFLSFFSVFISRSQTAWTCMACILLIYSISSRQFNIKRFVLVLGVLISGVFFPFIYFGEGIYISYISFATTYGSRIAVDILQLFDSIWIGSGYHVAQTAVGVDVEALTKNTIIFTDFFFLDIISALGLVGILFYATLFIILPCYIIIRKKYSYEYKVIAAPILVVGIAFGHYSPLQSTNVNIIIWYLFSQLSYMLDRKVYFN